MNSDADRAMTIDGLSVVGDALIEGFNPASGRAFATDLRHPRMPNSRF